MNLLHIKVSLVAVLAVAVLMILWTLVRRDRSSKSQFSFDQLIIDDDGRLSRAAVVLLGSFAFSVWAMSYLLLTGKMTEGYFGAFLLTWAAPAITKLIVNRPQVQPAATAIANTAGAIAVANPAPEIKP